MSSSVFEIVRPEQAESVKTATHMKIRISTHPEATENRVLVFPKKTPHARLHALTYVRNVLNLFPRALDRFKPDAALCVCDAPMYTPLLKLHEDLDGVLFGVIEWLEFPYDDKVHVTTINPKSGVKYSKVMDVEEILALNPCCSGDGFSHRVAMVEGEEKSEESDTETMVEGEERITRSRYTSASYSEDYASECEYYESSFWGETGDGFSHRVAMVEGEEKSEEFEDSDCETTGSYLEDNVSAEYYESSFWGSKLSDWKNFNIDNFNIDSDGGPCHKVFWE